MDHSWIARDEYFQCYTCGLECEIGVDNVYFSECSAGTSYCWKNSYHLLVATPDGGECYYCGATKPYHEENA